MTLHDQAESAVPPDAGDPVRLRRDITARSAAPRYIDADVFAEFHGFQPEEFAALRAAGTPWVPRPGVLLGSCQRAGWTFDISDSWHPGCPRYFAPRPQPYLDLGQMAAHHELSDLDEVWRAIEEGRIRHPDMWLCEAPGWLPQPKGRA